MNAKLQNLLMYIQRYGLWKSNLPPPGKCPLQPLLGSMHKLLHYPTSELTSLAPANLRQNAQVSCNYSSLGSPLLDGQAFHNSDSSDSLGLYGQLFRNYSILANRYTHADVVSYICCKAATVRSSVEPVYFPWTILTDPSFLAHLSSYLLPEAFHQTHRPALIIGPPCLEPKSSTTTLISHYLKWTWLQYFLLSTARNQTQTLISFCP